MTALMVPIQRYTVTSSGINTFTFSNIPQGFNDLKIYLSSRHNAGGVTAVFLLRFNGDNGSSSYSQTWSRNIGAVSTFRSAAANALPGMYSAGTSVTASNFAGSTAYIPNYSISGKNKQVLMESTIESNATSYDSTCYRNGGQWYKTEPITSISVILDSAGTMDAGSTITLYGVGTTRNRPKANGGSITTDGRYWYHTFRTTGASTFIPNENMSVEALCIGGGGGGGRYGGGGGGGIMHGVSPLLTSGQSYAVTVGAGGAGYWDVPYPQGDNGGNSQFLNIIGTGGGGGGALNVTNTGRNGGSGGGSGFDGGVIGVGLYSQGTSGGLGSNNSASYSGGGGGGAVSAGATSTPAVAGNGGAGSSAWTLWGLMTGTGQNSSGVFFYSGGGGGATFVGGNTTGTGGIGGGGSGNNHNGGITAPTTGSVGTANTGGGGGGSWAGGSGLVIIRYPI